MKYLIILSYFFLILSNGFIFNKLSKNTIQQIKYTLGGKILKKIKNKISNKSELPPINEDVIKISPGGLDGFYILGVCDYIKKNYNLDNYVYSGASAGAWNSLFMCFNGNTDDFINCILNVKYENITSILELQHIFKKNLLSTFNTSDFDLKKLYIGVTIFEKFRFHNTIFHNFDNIEDAVDCCIASSHIPLITGGFFNIYKNVFTFDGGFSLYPYINKNETLFITFNIWSCDKYNDFDLNTFNISDYNLSKNYKKGFFDTLSNKYKLDKIFINN